MKLLRALVASAAFFAFSAPVFAQPRCGDPQMVRTNLAVRFGEAVVRTVETEAQDGLPVKFEFWANADTRSWTFTVQREGRYTGTGRTIICLIGAGDNYALFDFDAAVREALSKSDEEA